MMDDMRIFIVVYKDRKIYRYRAACRQAGVVSEGLERKRKEARA